MTSVEIRARLMRIARWGRYGIQLALLLLAGVMAYYTWTVVSDPELSWQLLAEEHEVAEKAGSYGLIRLWIIAILWSLTDILGLIVLWTALSLFTLFARGEVFNARAVRFLRRIGWCLFLMGPATAFGVMINVLIFTMHAGAGQHEISIEVSDVQIYAMVIGLLIVMISLVMTEALRLARENESFV